MHFLYKLKWAAETAPFVIWKSVSPDLYWNTNKKRREYFHDEFCLIDRASDHFRGICKKIGADYEARTRYLHLGKVALYQMS